MASALTVQSMLDARLEKGDITARQHQELTQVLANPHADAEQKNLAMHVALGVITVEQYHKSVAILSGDEPTPPPRPAEPIATRPGSAGETLTVPPHQSRAGGAALRPGSSSTGPATLTLPPNIGAAVPPSSQASSGGEKTVPSAFDAQEEPREITLGLTPAVAPEDLSSDPLLGNAPQALVNGVPRPVLGGIPLLAKLGEGAFGAVYYGIHPRLDAEVAVKVTRFTRLTHGPEAIGRFVREAKLAAKIKSPHLIGVTDVNEERGLYYLVMEYVNGVSARACLDDVRTEDGRPDGAPGCGLPESTALAICIAATEGLAAAHAEGIIHRDIKPDNIMIPRAKGRGPQDLDYPAAKLADLGLARPETCDEGHGVTIAKQPFAAGTPGYMPFEQFEDARTVRKSADVFSMGATLYALLAGHAPYEGTSEAGIVVATSENRREPIGTVRPDISPATARVLDKCLLQDPDARYANAAALLNDLQACRAALRSTAEPPRAPAPSDQLAPIARDSLAQPEHAMALQPAPSLAASAPPTEGVIAPPATAARQQPPPRTGRRAALAAAVVLLLCGAAWFGISRLSRQPTPSGTTTGTPSGPRIAPPVADPREQSYDILMGKGNMALVKKDWGIAKTHFEVVLKMKPGDPAAAKGLEETRAALSQYDQDMTEGRRKRLANDLAGAEAAFSHALEVKPNDAAAGEGLKDIKATRDAAQQEVQYKEALAAARELLAAEKPNEQGMCVGLSTAQWTRINAAIMRALAIRPEDQAAKTLLERLGPPLWDGGESVASYARRLNVPPVVTFDIGGRERIELVLVPAGKFMMGSPENEESRGKTEVLHEVTITTPFYLANCEVTQGEYETVVGSNPSKVPLRRRPVDQVSWADAQEFCAKAGAKTEQTVRLPTEAEWEYACRAGARTPFSCGGDAAALGNVAWFNANSEETSHIVGQKKANAWGFFDMHGNVWEWCQDWHGDYPNGPVTDPRGAAPGADRVLRGGSWDDEFGDCRAARRNPLPPDSRYENIGFRVAMAAKPGFGPLMQSLKPTIVPPRPDVPPPQTDALVAAGPGNAAAYAKTHGLAQTISLNLAGAVKLDLVLIPPGKFIMGSPETERGRSHEETPHGVTITKAFYLGKYEVTNEAHAAIMVKKKPDRVLIKGKWRDPEPEKLPKCPMTDLTWIEAKDFCDAVGRRQGKVVRLPTEAEWEYACRAGSTTAYHSGDGVDGLGRVAWYEGTTNRLAQPVGGKEPNAFGLHDLHGNVAEWCLDWYGPCPRDPVVNPTGMAVGRERVARGGSYSRGPSDCRSAKRFSHTPDWRDHSTGFRIVVEVPAGVERR